MKPIVVFIIMALSLNTFIPARFLEELLSNNAHTVERKLLVDASDAISIGEELKNHAQKELDLQLQQYFNIGDVPSLDTFQKQPPTPTTTDNTTDEDTDKHPPLLPKTATTTAKPSSRLSKPDKNKQWLG